MPAIVTCPNCTRKLRVPDELLGKKVKCPDCKEPFVAQTEQVPADEAPKETPAPRSSNQGVSTRARPPEREPDSDLPPLPRPPEEDEDYPSQPSDDLNEEEHQEDEDDGGRRSRGGSVREAWKRVRLGLNLFIYGCYVFIGVYVFLFLGLVLAGILLAVSAGGMAAAFSSTNPRAGMGGAVGAAFAAMIVAFIGLGVFLIGFLAKLVLQGVGQGFMLSIPNKVGTGQRPMAIAAMALWAADILMYLFGQLLACMGGGLGTRSGGDALSLGANCMSLFSYLFMIAWYFVFMILLRIIAQAVRSRSNVGGSIISHMIAVPVFVVLSIIGGVGVICGGGAALFSASTGSGSTPGSAASAGVGIIILICAVFLLIFLAEVALYIWYVWILHQVRNAVSDRIGR